MEKVIRALKTENDMHFDEILSFTTENYIGIWSGAHNKFALIHRSDCEFDLVFIGNPRDLQALDDAVYDEVEEHIIKVSDRSDYRFILECEEEEK